MFGLEDEWIVVGDGIGSWAIHSVKGHIIASEIPHGATADHIVDLHNRHAL